MRKEELKKYIALKKIGYIYRLLESDAKKNNDIRTLESYKIQQEVFLGKLDENSSIIYLNTYNFPYDLTLYKYLEHRKLNFDTINEASDYFGIDSKLILDKIKEYIKYSYLELVEYNHDSSFAKLSRMIDTQLDKEATNSEIMQK